MELRLLAFFLALLSVAYSVPLNNWESNRCSKQCSLTKTKFNYEIGKTYVYKYDTNTRLKFTNGNDQEIAIKGKVFITVLDTCDFTLQLGEIDVQGPEYFDHSILREHPMMFSFDDGRITDVCPSAEDDQFAVNLKKGILSALQVSMGNLEGSKVITETDILGSCETVYDASQSQQWQGILIRKKKDSTSCTDRHQSMISLFPRKYFLQDQSIHNTPFLSNQYNCEIVIRKDIIQSSNCVDKNTLLPLKWSNSASYIESNLKLQFEQLLPIQKVSAPTKVTRHSLLYAKSPVASEGQELNAMNIIRELCNKVNNDIQPETANKFTQLVYELRQLSASAITGIYNDVKNDGLCSSKKIKDMFGDAMVMAGNEGSIKVLADLITRDQVSKAKAFYWTFMLTFNNQVTEKTIAAALPLLKKNYLQRQATLAISSMIHNHCHNYNTNCKSSQAIQQAVETIVSEFQGKCGAKSIAENERIVVALKAMANIGLTEYATQKIVNCIETANVQPVVQVAAIEALEKDAAHERVQIKMMHIFADQSQPTEVRIAAYKVIIKSPKTETIRKLVQQLQQETSQQVGAYVLSHMENVIESSDPLKRNVKNVLQSEKLPTDKFSKDIRKYSRYFEFSQHIDQLNLGGNIEGDIIYDNSFLARSLVLNASVFAQGNHLNLFKLHLRQKGLEGAFESIVGQYGMVNKKSLPDIMGEVMDYFTNKANEVRRIKRESFLQRRVDLLHERVSAQTDSLEGSLTLDFDGKTVIHFTFEDLRSLSKNELKELINNYKQNLNMAYKAMKGEGAFSYMFMDTTQTLPTINGLPIKADINGTAIFGYKGTDNVFYPSASVELSTKLGFEMKTSKPGLKWVNTVHTAPAIEVQVEYKNERPSRFTFSLPKEHTEIFSYRSQVYIVKPNNYEEALKSESKEISGCTKQLTKIFGIEACIATKVPTPLFNLNTPLIPLNGPLRFEYFIKKTDTAMKGWEFTIELPKHDEEETFIYKVAFDTPNSSHKRQISAQVQLLAPKDGSRTARLQFISPIKSFDTFAKYRWDAKELISKFDLKIDQQSHYSVEASLLKDGQDTKATYKPKLVIRIPQRKTIQLGGTIMVDNGRRSQIVVDLYSGKSNTNEQYTLKGKIIKDGTNRKLFRLSSDINANLGFIVFRIVSLADKNPKSSAVDCKVEYQTPNKLKHNLRFVSKMQDASSQSLTKFNTFWEMTFTEIPEYNFHINFNLMNKVLQHIETQLVYKWGDNFNNPRKEINLLYITKIDFKRNQKLPRLSKIDNQLNLKLLPFNLNYELQLNGNLEESETPKFHIEYTAKEKQHAFESLGSFNFKHVSKKPLHLSIDAYLKYPNRELRYSDNLREQSPNEYHGKSIIQLEPNKQTSIDYKYRIKSDGHQLTHHEFDFDLKTPTMRYPSKHNGLLRMTPNEFEFATKFDHNGRNMWDCKSLLSKQKPSTFELDTPMFNAKLDSDHITQRTTSFNLNGKSFALQHSTDVAYPAKQLSFTTKTVYQNKPILKVSSVFSKPKCKVALNSSPMNINFDYDTISQPLVGKLEIRSNEHPSYHLTSLLSQNGKLNLKSETKWRNNHVALVDSSLAHDQDSYLNIDTPHLKTALSCSSLRNPIKTAKFQLKGIHYPVHLEGDLTCKPHEYSINSFIKHDNQPIVDLKTVLSKNSQSNLIWKTRNYSGQLNVAPFEATKTLSWNVKDNRNILDHSTKFEVSPSRWGFNTRTNGLQNKYKSFALNGHLDDKSTHLKVKVDQATGTLELKPFHGAALELNGDKMYPIYHNTVIRRLPKSFEFISNTEHRGQKFFKVESMLHHDAKSTIKMETQMMNANLNIDPIQDKNVHFTFNSIPHSIDHNTKVSWTPKQVRIDSMTNKNYQQIGKINSILSKSEKSFVKVVGKPFEVTLEHDPTVEHKMVKLNYVGKLAPCVHTTTFTYHPKELNLNSETNWQNRPYASLQTKLSRHSNSLFNWKSNNFETDLNVLPFGQEKSIDLMVNKKYGTPIVHKTKVTLIPRESINVHTQTHQNAQQLYLIDSKLSKIEPSHVTVSTIPWNVKLQVDPINQIKKINFDVKGRHMQIDHLTDITCEPKRRVDFNSRTTHASRNVYVLKSSWEKYGQSTFDLDTQPINCQVKVDPYSQIKTGQLDFIHKNSNIKLWTKVDYSPMKSLKVLSKTEQGSKTLCDLDTHLKTDDRSYMNIDFPKSYGKFEINPYSNVKTGEFQWNAKDNSYAHQLAASLDNKVLKSQFLSTKYGNTYAQLKTEISKQNPSNVHFILPNWNGEMEVDPYSHQKSINWKLNSVQNQINHDTSIKHQPGNFLLNSVTNYKNAPYLKINSNIVNQGKSYFNFQSPKTQLDMDLSPYDQEKSGKVYFHLLPTYRHVTEVKVSPKKWFVETETKQNNNNLFAFKTNLENKLASVSCNNPLFKTKFDVDLVDKTNINLDYLAKHSNNRHILCSFNTAQDKQLRNEYSLDLQWNADHNPTDSLKFRLATYLNQIKWNKLHHIEFDGELFNLYNIKVNTKCNYNDAVHGPHEIDITLRTPQVNKQLILTHEIIQNKCKCGATLFTNGLEITKIQNIIEYHRNSDKFMFSEDFSIVSKSKSIDGVKFTLSHTHSAEKIDTILTSALPDFKPIAIHFKSNKHIDNYSGLVSVQLTIDTPLNDFKHQTLTLTSEWNKNNGDGKLNGQFINTFGKKIDVNGIFKINANDQSSLSLDCVSDIRQVPNVKLNANLFNAHKRKGGQLNVDYVNKRIVDVNAIIQLQTEGKFDGDFDMDTEWTPRFKFNTRGERSSNKMDYLMSLKKDDDEIFGAKLFTTKNSREFKGNGLIKAFGNDLLQVDMLNNDDQGIKYNMNIKGMEDIIKVNFRRICTGQQVKHTFVACKKACYTFESNIYDKSSRYFYDQLISLSMKSDKTPLQYRIDYILNTKQHLNSKIMVTFEDKQFGYEINSGEQTMNVRIQLLERTIEINERKEANKHIIEILPNSVKRDDVFTIVAHYDKQMNNYVQTVQCELKLSHPMWRQPIGVTYKMNTGETSKPYEGKLNVKYGPKDDQELIFNALFEHPNADVRNTSLTFKVNDPDYKLVHFELQAHLGSNQQDITTGLNLIWLDNHGEGQKAFFLLEANVDKKQLTITTWCGNNNLLIDGTWQIADDVITVDGDAEINGEKRKAHMQVELKDKPCIEIQMLKEPAIQTFKWRSCVDTDGNNILKFLSESYNGNVKSSDISLLFDRNGRNMIRGALHWKPELISNLIYTIQNAYTRQNTDIFHSMSNNIAKKWHTIRSTTYNDVGRPLSNKLYYEYNKVNRELMNIFEPIMVFIDKLVELLPTEQQVSDYYEEVMYKFWNGLSAMIPDHLKEIFDDILRKVTRELTQACTQNSICYSLAFSYERKGIQGVYQEAQKLSRTAFRDWKHSVVQSTGNLGRTVRNLIPEGFTSDIKDAFSSLGDACADIFRPIMESSIFTRLTNIFYGFYDYVNNYKQSILQCWSDCMNKMYQNLMNNEDLRPIMETVNEMYHQAKYQLDKIEWNNISYLSEQLKKVLITPKLWIPNTRFTVWNPEQGEISFEVRRPTYVPDLRSVWKYRNNEHYSTPSDFVNRFKSNVYGEWVPPFKSQAMLVAGKHFITFDKKFYDFAGHDCSYLLARDFLDGNFSVMAKYNQMYDGHKVDKSIIVQSNGKNIEIMTKAGQVKVDDKEVELPLFLGKTTVMRQGETIIVDDKHGIIVECLLTHDICTVSVAGWYFGKTGGLFGTYDYEPENDMRLPKGKLARNVEELATGWEVKNSCHTQNQVRHVELSPNSYAYEQCEYLLNNENSPLRVGFGVINPKDYFKMCLRHTSVVKRQEIKKSVCTITAAYVKALRFNHVNINLPSQCLSCDKIDYGSRKLWKVEREEKTADVVFVIEEHECNRPLVSQMKQIADLIDRQLIVSNIKNNRFAVVGYAGADQDGSPHWHTSRGQLLFQSREIALAVNNMNYRRRYNKYSDVDTFEAIRYASEFKWRKGSSKTLVLLSCTPCKEKISHLDYSDIQRLLLSEGITLHVLNDKRIEINKRYSSKNLNIFGIDAFAAYNYKDLSSMNLHGQRDLRRTAIVSKDICIALAHESRGSYFTTLPAINDGTNTDKKSWRSLLAKRIEKTATPEMRQQCECVLDRDGLHSTSICRPSKPWRPLH